MELILRFLIKISSLNRPIALVTLKILKLLNKNRGYFKIGNNIMFLDFLDPIDRKIIINKKYEENEISTFGFSDLMKPLQALYPLYIGLDPFEKNFSLIRDFIPSATIKCLILLEDELANKHSFFSMFISLSS